MDVEATWATWVFLAILGAATAGMLWLWSTEVRRWRRQLPVIDPPGWTPTRRYEEAGGVAREQFGSTFESATDPGARWRLYRELPDKLVAVRRPKHPRPWGVISASAAGTAGLDADIDDTRVLLRGMTVRPMRVAMNTADQFRGRHGGADRFIELLIEAGATPVDADGPAAEAPEGCAPDAGMAPERNRETFRRR